MKLKNNFNLDKIKKTLFSNRTMFLLPIFLVAGISISHVVSWYDMSNPINWAIYLSLSVEVGAMAALIAATNRIKGGVWFMFGIVTLIQMIGNIFYSYKEIDETSKLFLSWIELIQPISDLINSEQTTIIQHKRILALLEGGLLPIISLTSLHFYIKYKKPSESIHEDTTEHSQTMVEEIIEEDEEFGTTVEDDTNVTDETNSESSTTEEFIVTPPKINGPKILGRHKKNNGITRLNG